MLKVSSRSNPNSVAGALARVLKEEKSRGLKSGHKGHSYSQGLRCSLRDGSGMYSRFC